MKSDKLSTNQDDINLIHFLEEKIKRERRKKVRIHLVRDLVITAAITFVLFSVVIGVAIIQGDSMKPNFTSGNLALFNRLTDSYQKNDVVIFKDPASDEILIKRIVAVAGDTVDIDDENGTLLVNDVVQENEATIGNTYTKENGITFPYTVPSNCVFVLGDNREVAVDSRDFGAVSTDNLLGKVVFVMRIMDD
jgi:signal peptidase I